MTPGRADPARVQLPVDPDEQPALDRGAPGQARAHHDFATVFIASAAIVGGAPAKSRPRVAFWLLLTTGLSGFIAISGAWLISGPLLIFAAFLTRGGIPRAAPNVT